MAHGGKRDGAGRPLGSPNKATKERQAKVAAEGETPLDVMIAAMRYHHAAALDLMALNEPTDEQKLELRAELNLAGAFAADAAPYVHPKLANVQSNVQHSVSDELAELLNAIDSKTRGVPRQVNGVNPTPTSH